MSDNTPKYMRVALNVRVEYLVPIENINVGKKLLELVVKEKVLSTFDVCDAPIEDVHDGLEAVIFDNDGIDPQELIDVWNQLDTVNTLEGYVSQYESQVEYLRDE